MSKKFVCCALVIKEDGTRIICEAPSDYVSKSYPDPDQWDGHAFCEAHKGTEEGVTTFEEGEALYRNLKNIKTKTLN